MISGTARDNRLAVDAVLCRYPEGQWRDQPECFWNGKNVHRRFGRRVQSEILQTVLPYADGSGLPGRVFAYAAGRLPKIVGIARGGILLQRHPVGGWSPGLRRTSSVVTHWLKNREPLSVSLEALRPRRAFTIRGPTFPGSRLMYKVHCAAKTDS